jgi:hypothetical protein
VKARHSEANSVTEAVAGGGTSLVLAAGTAASRLLPKNSENFFASGPGQRNDSDLVNLRPFLEANRTCAVTLSRVPTLLLTHKRHRRVNFAVMHNAAFW